jgi:hypothetical protein
VVLPASWRQPDNQQYPTIGKLASAGRHNGRPAASTRPSDPHLTDRTMHRPCEPTTSSAASTCELVHTRRRHDPRHIGGTSQAPSDPDRQFSTQQW